jgi:sugar lactone lactonase YvrE
MSILKVIIAALAALAAYLLFWPTGLEPVAWTPPAAPKLEGVYVDNDKLAGIQRIGEGVGRGPEAVNVDATGQLYAGYADGRIVKFTRDGGKYTELADTDGRPLGITFGPDGGLVIADARRGLLHLGNKIRPLVDEADGQRFGFTDDVDNTRLDKNVYFTDASAKFGYGRHLTDLLEHGANGRLLEYNVKTKQTRVLMKGLHFANGVAVGPNDEYVLVAETGEYRILRYWLKGPQTGTHDVFVDNLPGFPDNVSFNNRDKFWLALAAPRDAMLDELLPGNFLLRKVAARLPAILQPRPEHRAFVLGLDLQGHVVANLQHGGRDAYAPITSVREFGPWLYFGSLTETAIGRLPLNHAVPDAAPPPAGWERVPQPKVEPLRRSAEEEREAAEEEEREERQERQR